MRLSQQKVSPTHDVIITHTNIPSTEHHRTNFLLEQILHCWMLTSTTKRLTKNNDNIRSCFQMATTIVPTKTPMNTLINNVGQPCWLQVPKHISHTPIAYPYASQIRRQNLFTLTLLGGKFKNLRSIIFLTFQHITSVKFHSQQLTPTWGNIHLISYQ